MSTTADVQPSTSVTVTVHTKGQDFDESTVDQWELKAARRALKNLKNVAGGQVMMDLLKEQIDAGDRFHKELVETAGGAWRESRTEFAVRGLTGTQLTNWFRGQAGTGEFGDKALLVNAHPEHYVEPPTYPGGMVETIGGHLTRFKVAMVPELPPVIAEYLDPAYPQTLAQAELTLDDGTAFAYCAHQARDTETGAAVVVRVIYPATSPDALIEGHCEHLAIEFRSWIRNAAAAA